MALAQRRHDLNIAQAPGANARVNVNQPRKIWWSNSIFFVATHLLAFLGIYCRPPSVVPRQTIIMAILVWQLACFGITIGYHRMYSHRSFRGSFGVRVVLAALGSMAFQGSIKWWCLRHRLHHRFTDDVVHDPYAATRGLFFSHMGWIFYKPTYQKLETIDRQDLDSDPVARFQHRYYVPIALFFGLVLPSVLGLFWDDALGAFIYGGLVARLAIWHCTFLVNSLAHWDGLQPYSDENTSRGDLIMALLTCGEGNHNFHAFPQDFRSGPSPFDWDPSKWIILLLHRFGLVNGLRRARAEDMKSALEWMAQKGHGHHQSDQDQDHDIKYHCDDYSSSSSSSAESESEWGGPVWDVEKLKTYIQEKPGRCVVVINDYAMDVTNYLGDHPGGAALLRAYSFCDANDSSDKWREASWAFFGGLNVHSRAARRRMAELRIAKVRV